MKKSILPLLALVATTGALAQSNAVLSGGVVIGFK